MPSILILEPTLSPTIPTNSTNSTITIMPTPSAPLNYVEIVLSMVGISKNFIKNHTSEIIIIFYNTVIELSNNKIEKKSEIIPITIGRVGKFFFLIFWNIPRNFFFEISILRKLLFLKIFFRFFKMCVSFGTFLFKENSEKILCQNWFFFSFQTTTISDTKTPEESSETTKILITFDYKCKNIQEVLLVKKIFSLNNGKDFSDKFTVKLKDKFKFTIMIDVSVSSIESSGILFLYMW